MYLFIYEQDYLFFIHMNENQSPRGNFFLVENMLFWGSYPFMN